MRKKLLLIFVTILSISLIGCSNIGKVDEENTHQSEIGGKKEESLDIDDDYEEKITKFIEEFGGKLQLVSLLSPEDILAKDMEENYGGYVTEELINQWMKDPLNAPGRLTSSPWPDRIDVLKIEELTQGKYKVQGEIVEKTSSEKDEIRRAIILNVIKSEDKFLIESSEIERLDDNSALIYTNEEFGFTFNLPISWEGYSVLNEKWTSNDESEAGTKLIIRHPQWTNEVPRQDIPILIFTHEQWKSIENEELSIGAAPIGPKELGQNSEYVFALPARYNFSFPEGHEEVDDIMESNPLKAINR
jgi:hypothetical protein